MEQKQEDQMQEVQAQEAEEYQPVYGIWGQRRLRYLMEYKQATYISMKMDGTLEQHLIDVDKQARRIIDETVEAFARVDGCNEEMKARDPMSWVGLMNNYRHTAEEIVYSHLIHS